MRGTARVLRACLCVFVCGAGFAQEPPSAAHWRAPEIESRIEDGIRSNRMDWAVVEVRSGGQPVAGAEVSVDLVEHEFLFGANGFMVEGFPTVEENLRFESAFTALFNFVTAPFYWKSIEPAPGQVRFTRQSQPLYRRPPPDVVIGFARRHKLQIKGHPMVWDNSAHQVPEWLPPEPEARERLLWANLERNAGRYRGEIPIWDVVNEACSRHVEVPMPDDYVFGAFDLAARILPPSSTMLINETTRVWKEDHGEYSQYYLLIQNLLLRRARVDAIGLQFHFFSERDHADARDGKAFTPRQIFAVLDLYARLGLPIHITEITIPTLPNTPEGERVQAELANNYYRAWFSHPAVAAITWWNLVDQTAVQGEDKWNGGLLRRDFSAKPSYEALRQLIRTEWRTSERGHTDASGAFRFRGFHGTYNVTVRRDGKSATETFVLRRARGTPARIKVRIE